MINPSRRAIMVVGIVAGAASMVTTTATFLLIDQFTAISVPMWIYAAIPPFTVVSIPPSLAIAWKLIKKYRPDFFLGRDEK